LAELKWGGGTLKKDVNGNGRKRKKGNCDRVGAVGEKRATSESGGIQTLLSSCNGGIHRDEEGKERPQRWRREQPVRHRAENAPFGREGPGGGKMKKAKCK